VESNEHYPFANCVVFFSTFELVLSNECTYSINTVDAVRQLCHQKGTSQILIKPNLQMLLFTLPFVLRPGAFAFGFFWLDAAIASLKHRAGLFQALCRTK